MEPEQTNLEPEPGSFKCPVCYDDDDTGLAICTLPCSHQFHVDCILESFRYNPRCPMCRDTGRSERTDEDNNVLDADDQFINTIGYRTYRKFRKTFVTNAVRCLKRNAFKHTDIKNLMRRYTNAKTSIKDATLEMKSIKQEYRQVTKEYSKNPIVARYRKSARQKREKWWALTHLENIVFRRFSHHVPLATLYDAPNVKEAVESQFQNVVLPEMSTHPVATFMI